MKNRWKNSLLVLGLWSQVSLQAWSTANAPQEAPSTAPEKFPFAQQQEWYTEESYLLMEPYMENMIYGNKDDFDHSGSNYSNSIKVQEPSFDWSSGVRFALGRYLPNHDLWDVSLTTTFYYTDAESHSNGNLSADVGFNPTFFGAITDPADKGTFNWRLNYWTIDLMVGRQFDMTRTTVFHPYFGLRSSLQYQEAKATFTRSSEKAISRIDNDFWGIGPRVGTSFIYYFGTHFSFLANLSTSLLVGSQDLKMNTALPASKTKSSDSLGVIRSNLEASLGLGWEKWFKEHTVRVAPSIDVEGIMWFAMNQLYNFYPTSSATTNVETRRRGNLGLMGVSFNLQVDF